MRPPTKPRPATKPRSATGRVVDRAGGHPSTARTSDPPGVRVPVRSETPARRTMVPSAPDTRLVERAAMRRHLLRRRLVGALVAAGAAGVVAWVLFFSGVLALDPAQVRLSGQGSAVDPAAVGAVIETRAGTPLPRLDTVELRRDLLDVPGVRAAEVTRVWPNGLEVRLVSREPVAAVSRAGGGFTLLDPEAVPVGRVDEAPAGLPVIAVPEDDPDGRVALAVLAVLQGLPDDLAEQVASASAQSQDTVRLVLSDGAQVEWGSADEIALKVRVLQALRTAEPSRGAAVYDVSAPTMPITRS